MAVRSSKLAAMIWTPRGKASGPSIAGAPAAQNRASGETSPQHRIEMRPLFAIDHN
jgi:hypothetical protein